MGVNDRVPDKRERKAAVSEAKRLRRTGSKPTGGVADWASVDGVLLAKAVAAIAGLGGALRLGYTRDGGAYAIGFYGDGDPFTEYVPPGDDVDEFLKGVISDYSK